MELGKVAGETAIDLMKSENMQNKAAGLMGMLFPYAGLKQKAVELYVKEIEESNMSTEAKMYAILNTKKNIKRIKNQKAIADIAIENAKKGTDFTDKSGVDEEWFERFMDFAKFVSSEDIQLIWGKILANEFQYPGTTPPNMIRILTEITPDLAMAFRNLCSMKIMVYPLSEDEEIIDKFQCILVPYRKNEDYFPNIGIRANILNELETLGVIKLEMVNGFIRKEVNNDKILIGIGDKLEVICKHRKGKLPIGNVMLTSAGKALKRVLI